MQMLWFRAAKTNSSCRCRSCLHAATSIARRTTIAASKRRITAGDIFTACYSSILATAAVADAKVKQDRREEWDRLIAEARAELSAQEPGPSQQEPAESFHVAGISPSPTIEPGLTRDSPSPSRRVLLRNHIRSRGGYKWTSDAQTEEKFSTLGLERERSPILQASDMAFPQAIYDESKSITEQKKDAEEFDEPLALQDVPREPNQVIHLQWRENMARALVDEMLAKVSFPSENETTLSKEDNIWRDAKEMMEHVGDLRSSFHTLPAYNWESDAFVKEQRERLHYAMQQIFKKTTPENFSVTLAIAKVCHNLLVLTVPPNIVTYNILMGELHRLGEHELVRVVIDNVIDQPTYKPDATTVGCFLDHFVAVGDPVGFRAICKRMNATEGDMSVRRRTVFELNQPFVLNWVMNSKSIHRGAYIHEKFSRNTSVFDSLIKGALVMQGPKAAVRHIRSALREGCQVRSNTLCCVIDTCISQLDFGTSLSLVKCILELWRGEVVHLGITYAADVRHGIGRLLAFCGINPSGVQHQSAPRVPTECLQNMVRHMEIEAHRHAIDHNPSLNVSGEDKIASSPDREMKIVPTDVYFNDVRDGVQRDEQDVRQARIKMLEIMAWKRFGKAVSLQRDIVDMLESSSGTRLSRIGVLQKEMDVLGTMIIKREAKRFAELQAELQTELGAMLAISAQESAEQLLHRGHDGPCDSHKHSQQFTCLEALITPLLKVEKIKKVPQVQGYTLPDLSVKLRSMKCIT